MFSLLVDGVSILITYWQAVLFLFVAFAGFGLFAFRQIAPEEKDPAKIGFTSFVIGGALMSLVTFALVAVGYFWQVLLIPGAFTILLAAGIILVRELRLNKFDVNWRHFALALIALIVLLVSRLVFLEYILLPPHSDSPIHYEVVADFLEPQSESGDGITLGNIWQRYYHFGFHSLAAWLTVTTNVPPEGAISLLGQVFLFTAPISIFALTHSITKNVMSATFAALLAAFGWAMPAFGVNWGKFPALSALAVAPAIAAAAATLKQSDWRKPAVILWFAILALSTALLHSRIVVCLLFALLAYFLVRNLETLRELTPFQSVRLSVLGAISLLPHSAIIKDFYGSISILVVILFLLPFAIRKFTKASIGAIVFTFLLWIALISRITVSGKTQTLLDEQFLAIGLFIPLSLIAGLGLAGLLGTIGTMNRIRWVAVGILAGLLALNMQASYFYPDPCCNYFSQHDQDAIEWIRESTSPQALFLISAAQSQFQTIGTDSGIWIEALTQRPVNKLPFDTDLSSAAQIEKICQTGARDIYLYSGGREYSFSTEQADSERMHAVFTSGKTVILQVIGCQ